MTPYQPPRPAGVLLARRGDIAFIQVDAVLAIKGESVAFYCPADAWEQSPDAQADRLDTAIAEKQRELAELVAERGRWHALSDSPPTEALPGPKTPRQRWRCLVCGKPISNFHLHGKRAHPKVPDPRTLRGEPVGAEVSAELAQDEREGPEAGERLPEDAATVATMGLERSQIAQDAPSEPGPRRRGRAQDTQNGASPK